MRWNMAARHGCPGICSGPKVSVIAKLVQTSEDRVREMIHIFNEAGMDSLFPRWSEGRPATFTPKVRARICRIARARPAKFGLPFTTWSLDKLRDLKGAQTQFRHAAAS